MWISPAAPRRTMRPFCRCTKRRPSATCSSTAERSSSKLILPLRIGARLMMTPIRRYKEEPASCANPAWLRGLDRAFPGRWPTVPLGQRSDLSRIAPTGRPHMWQRSLPGRGWGLQSCSVPLVNASGCVECWTPKDFLLAEGQPLTRKTSEHMALMRGPAPTLFQIRAAGEFGGALVLS